MAGRPRGSTSRWRNPANVAANHTDVLLEIWLAGAPVLMIRVLLPSLADHPEDQALVEEYWRARGGERRHTVPPKIKRKLCQLAVAHVVELRRQAILYQCNRATEKNLRRQGYSDGQIAEIKSRCVPEAPHVEPPDIEKVLEIVSRRAPPGTLRRKAKDRGSHISPSKFYAQKFQPNCSSDLAPLKRLSCEQPWRRIVFQNGENREYDKAQPHDVSATTGPGNRLDNPTDREQSTIVHGQEAWHRLGCDRTWENWPHVGDALRIGRSGAMREAGVNRPVGRRYNFLFAAWLKEFGFEDLDKADRSRLFAVMDHLDEIEAWRATLTPTERLRLNHPSAVWRKWKSATAVSQNCRLSPIQKCREENDALKQEIVRLRRECEHFGGDRWEPADRPEAIAIAMVAKLSRNKAAAVAGAILKALEGKVAE